MNEENKRHVKVVMVGDNQKQAIRCKMVTTVGKLLKGLRD